MTVHLGSRFRVVPILGVVIGLAVSCRQVVVSRTSSDDVGRDLKGTSAQACTRDGDCVAGGTCIVGTCTRGSYILVSPGTFTMGSPADEPGRELNEAQRAVTLTVPYWLKATEVTQAEWFDVMGTRPANFPACGDDCPVEQVSWWDAVAYCNALSLSEGLTPCYALEGCTWSSDDPAWQDSCTGITWDGLTSCTGYRLPTEAEWEYAARAGTTARTWAGAVTYTQDGKNCEPVPELSAVAWWCGSSGDTTHPVGSRPSNPWGFADVLGNAGEWCWDGYDDAPPASVDPVGNTASPTRTIHGGSYRSFAATLRSAARFGHDPRARDVKVPLGLRTARTRASP